MDWTRTTGGLLSLDELERRRQAEQAQQYNGVGQGMQQVAMTLQGLQEAKQQQEQQRQLLLLKQKEEARKQALDDAKLATEKANSDSLVADRNAKTQAAQDAAQRGVVSGLVAARYDQPTGMLQGGTEDLAAQHPLLADMDPVARRTMIQDELARRRAGDEAQRYTRGTKAAEDADKFGLSKSQIAERKSIEAKNYAEAAKLRAEAGQVGAPSAAPAKPIPPRLLTSINAVKTALETNRTAQDLLENPDLDVGAWGAAKGLVGATPYKALSDAYDLAGKSFLAAQPSLQAMPPELRRKLSDQPGLATSQKETVHQFVSNRGAQLERELATLLSSAKAGHYDVSAFEESPDAQAQRPFTPPVVSQAKRDRAKALAKAAGHEVTDEELAAVGL